MKKLLLTILISTFALSANADAGKTPKDEINPFSQCGLGGAIFQKVPVAAMISNVIWDFGLTASTSSISSPETCKGKRMSTAKLILQTLPELERDIALGDGKYLTALTETIDCNGIKQESFNSSLQNKYIDVLSNNSYDSKSTTERASDVYNTVRRVTSNVEGCNTIL